MSRNLNLILIGLLTAGYISSAYALESDQGKPVNIISDSWTYNFKTGIDIFEGHVKVDQGTTHITADKLITKKNHQHKIEEATAYGYEQLAHFWTVPKLNEPELHAHAKIIRFYPLSANFTLEQAVQVLQGKNSFQGELIHYNNVDQTITVPPSTNGKAVLVYNPERNKS